MQPLAKKLGIAWMVLVTAWMAWLGVQTWANGYPGLVYTLVGCTSGLCQLVFGEGRGDVYVGILVGCPGWLLYRWGRGDLDRNKKHA